MILDGFGIAKTEGNAIAAAKRPNLDKLFSENPITKIGASGMDVGLPDGQMGNSEVGHTNIGAGRIVYQELTRITKAVQDGSFFENEALVHAMNNAKETGPALHLIGLLSNGGVHSHNQHLYGLLEMAKKMGVENVYVHALLDGRDVPPSSGKDFVKELMEKMKEIGVGKVATVMGRYYAMDRDNRWERVEKAYNAMVCREGEEFACPVCAVSKSYENEVTDEFVVPCVIKGGAPGASGDSSRRALKTPSASTSPIRASSSSALPKPRSMRMSRSSSTAASRSSIRVRTASLSSPRRSQRMTSSRK